ncbi:MAG: sn-glycerol-1-phosphate dehydrogenase [Erysipelotrichaceae bacterium]|nr:sn-glycerol-1-phosphate dehydrogenase [Erysipelotrichaceae bacterium]
MDEILNLPIYEVAGCEFDCSCGRHHVFPVEGISVGKNAIKDLVKFAAPYKEQKILVVFDNNTYKVAGRKAVELLKENGFEHIKELLFETGNDILIPDETTLGRILIELDQDCGLVIAVGSGVINDSCKYVTAKTGKPFIIVATAPSMDGYVSAGAPIFSQGFKLSPQAHLPIAVIGDTDILSTAPDDMIAAGFGDIVGKITAIADWDVAVKVKNEYRCDTCVTLVNRALDKVFRNAEGLQKRDGEALSALMEALILTGTAMALADVSRPASGAEHMIAHCWEMDEIKRGLNPIHHGTQVGIATPVVARIFEHLHDDLPEGTAELCPPHEEIEELLRRGGTITDPKEIGISRELFHYSLLNSHDIRPRYSVLRYAKDLGRLEEIADKITEEYYGKE